MQPDRQLLERYAVEGSEAAFGELVALHVNLVYSAALRRTGGDLELAKDAAQLVFAALARKARSLPRDVVLAGWLHRATQYAAAQLLRTEHRRQAREQEALAMNALQSEPALVWDQIRPLLDEALDRLNRRNRDALMLRFFEQRTLAEVGTTLGITEEAARKRVNRALEKVRTDLVRRGVATTGSALAAAISVNAVQVAPAGLAPSLAAASLAGIAASAGATVTLGHSFTAWLNAKTLAAMVVQKALLATVLVAVLGTAGYRAHQLSIASGEAERRGKQQTAFAEQARQLQRERDQATNLLAAAQADNARLKSGQMLAEVLRLRGQVGALRHEVGTNGTGAYPTLMSRLVNDPAMKRQIHEEVRQWARGILDPIFKDLKLTQDQVDKATGMCAEAGLKEVEKFATLAPGILSQAELKQIEENLLTDLYQQLLPVVGENGIARMKALHDELPARTTVSLLNGQLGAELLSGEENARLLQIVKGEPLDLTWGIARDDVAFWGKPQDIQEHLAKIEASNEHVLQQASSFLNPAQLAALSTVLSNGINYRVVRAAAYIQQR